MGKNLLIKSTERELTSIRNMRKMAMNQVHLNHVVVDQTIQQEHAVKRTLKDLLADARAYEAKASDHFLSLSDTPPSYRSPDDKVRIETSFGKNPCDEQPLPTTVGDFDSRVHVKKHRKKHTTLRFKANAHRKVKGFPLRGVQRALYELHHNYGENHISYPVLVSNLKEHMRRRALSEGVVDRGIESLMHKGILREYPKGSISLV